MSNFEGRSNALLIAGLIIFIPTINFTGSVKPTTSKTIWHKLYLYQLAKTTRTSWCKVHFLLGKRHLHSSLKYLDAAAQHLLARANVFIFCFGLWNITHYHLRPALAMFFFVKKKCFPYDYFSFATIQVSNRKRSGRAIKKCSVVPFELLWKMKYSARAIGLSRKFCAVLFSRPGHL